MRFTISFQTVYVILALYLASCAVALAEAKVHTTMSLEDLAQADHLAQKPFSVPNVVSSYGYAQHQPMQAASEAGSSERPIGKMVTAVIVSGVLFGLGMGM